MKRKIFSIILVGAMLLTGCTGGGAATTDTGNNTNGGGDAQTTADADTDEGEARVVTTALMASAVQTFRDDDTWDDNVWTRLIKDELNVDVEVTFTADSATDAYKNQMSLLLASGDFPDVLCFDDGVWLEAAVKGGYVMDITDVFEEYASPEVKAYRDRYPESFEGVSFDGRLYGIPHMNDNFHNSSYLWIRDDWLEYAGGKAPETVEEMVEMAKLFATGDPDGDGIDGNTYGLGLARNVIENNFGTLGGLFAAHGVPNYGDSGIFYRDSNNDMTFSYIQPEVKEALGVVKELFDAGAIDPEFVAKDLSALETDIALNNIGMGYHMNWGTWHPFAGIYSEDGVITRPYPVPKAAGHDVLQGTRSNAISVFFVVGANAEHPEAIMEILNLYYDVAVNGTQEQFLTYWADEQYRFAPIFLGIPGENYSDEVIAALQAGDAGDLRGQALEYYNYVVGFEDGSLADDMNAYGTWGQMFERGSMAIAMEERDNGQQMPNAMADKIPESWQQDASTLVDMARTNFVAFITGTRDLEEFDDYVQEWLDAGGAATLAEMEELYPAN